MAWASDWELGCLYIKVTENNSESKEYMHWDEKKVMCGKEFCASGVSGNEKRC